MNTKNTRVSLDMPSSYHEQLKILAIKRGQTLRELILESVDTFISDPSVIGEIPEHERWVFDTANKHIVDHIKKSLKQKPTISRSFVK